MATVRRHRALTAFGATGLALTLALTGCGAGGSEEAASTAGEAPAAAPAKPQNNGATDDGSADDGGAGTGTGSGSGEQTPASGGGGGAPVINRDVIYTGSVTVRVTDVTARAEETIRLVEAAGGFVGADARTSDVNPTGTPYEKATITLRIPRDAFYDTLGKIAALGEQENRKVDAQDVTEAVVDLDSRIASQRAQVESARKLLAQAKTLNDLVSLENELARRQADLASLEAKRDRLKDLSALSTLTVELVQDTAPVAEEEPEERSGFLFGLRNGWNSFLSFGAGVLTLVGLLLPWLAGLGLPVLALVLLWRRSRRRRPVIPVSAPPPASAP
ncbi:DUF4349 domain-containing protein [Catenuloplanes atrovinosus]|uniref:Regulator of replication initiation timing/uncharacterized spore protein YtfJ n=1 Tax=Catenuloplanes atrovinosus TaxID=137266 RepID=A0AAE3YW21_9ACTN|nr:DUF4349 domain-containing protein [Catenuloplanes atrovinosus]MDR7280745.1 regulator of replication initiation timing/uncharacterized spore protein YtfJ [Catenuloplanes atrovinosus]